MAARGVRTLIVNPSGQEIRGVLTEVLEDAGAVVDELATQAAVAMLVGAAPAPDVRVVASLPSSSEGHDCLLVLGSPFSVCTETEPNDSGLMAPLGLAEDIEGLIRDFDQHGKPVLGICLGAQLIARAFGGAVRRMPRDWAHTSLPVPLDGEQPPRLGMEFGWHAQEFTPEAWSDPLVGKALRTLLAQECELPTGRLELKFHQWHGDTFDLPQGAACLSTRRECPSQAFRVGCCAYAFQYHIEVGQAMAEKWCQMFAQGFDCYAGRDAWTPLRTVGAQSLLERQLAEVKKEGSIRRAEAFTAHLVRAWLEQAAVAAAARRATAGGEAEGVKAESGPRSRSRSRTRSEEAKAMEVQM